MFNSNDKLIGVREYSAAIIVVLFTKSTNYTPIIFFKSAYNAGWVVPMLSAIFIMLPLLCICTLLKRYAGKGLIEIINSLLGRIIGFIMTLILLIAAGSAAAVDMRQDADVINSIFFPNTKIMYLVITLMLISAILAAWGLKTIMRTALMIMPYVIVAAVLLFLFSLSVINLDFLFPLAGRGVKYIAYGTLRGSFLYQSIIMLSICFPMFKDANSYRRGSLIGVGISAIILSISYSLYVESFDYPAILVINYPFYSLTRLLTLGRFITNVEPVFLLCMVICAVIYHALYLYIVAAILKYMFNLKSIEKLVPFVSIFIAIIAMIPENFLKVEAVFSNIIEIIIIFVTVIVPVILLIISTAKGDYKKC